MTNDGTPSIAFYVGSYAAAAAKLPRSYYPPDGVWDVCAAYQHQPTLGLNGAVYAFPHDDQNDDSSSLSDSAAVSVSITLARARGRPHAYPTNAET